MRAITATAAAIGSGLADEIRLSFQLQAIPSENHHA